WRSRRWASAASPRRSARGSPSCRRAPTSAGSRGARRPDSARAKRPSFPTLHRRTPEGWAMKRVFLFLLTNLLVITVAGVVLRLLGVDAFLVGRGVEVGLPQLLLYCAVFGMLGSVISLLLSKPMAMRM